jgi:hypothetical protein
MRYVAPEDRYEPECLYIPLDCGRQAEAVAVAA